MTATDTTPGAAAGRSAPAASGSAPSVPPQPLPDADSAPFWQATARGELAMCRCQACGLWLQPPLERCRRCAGPTAFEPVTGLGSVYTFIVQRQAVAPGYVENLPYAVALVELDEQHRLRLPGRVIGIAPEAVRCGLRVRAELQPLPGGHFTVPVFRPIES